MAEKKRECKQEKKSALYSEEDRLDVLLILHSRCRRDLWVTRNGAHVLVAPWNIFSLFFRL